MTADSQKYEDDDGRVICSMDVPGMPWHDRRARRAQRAAASSQPDPMTGAETRRYIWHSILAGLIIVAIFSATWVLFTLFCLKVWFRY